MPKRRKLTPFLCREMLYEYELGLLDPDRKAAVEEFLKTDQDCRETLEDVRSALTYAKKLSEIPIRADILDHLREAENAVSLGRKYASWKEWPQTLRWSITALVISFVVAGFVAIVPWNQLPSFGPAKKSDLLKIADLSRPAASDFEAEGASSETEVADDDSVTGSGETEIPGAPPVQVAENTEEPNQPEPAPTPSASPSPAAVVAVAETPTPTPKPVKKEPKPKGFVYRAFMNLGNLEEIGPKIAEHITELGGAKAGEVELGWKRGNGRYYHFSLPEENEEKLLEILRAYGPVRMSKDPHHRVMPQGQVRFILWIEPL